MTVNTNTLIAMTEANQNFSKVTRMVDEEGIAVILKNNKPKYIVVSFDAKDRRQVYKDVCETVQKEYPDYTLQIAMDTDFSEEL